MSSLRIVAGLTLVARRAGRRAAAVARVATPTRAAACTDAVGAVAAAPPPPTSRDAGRRRRRQRCRSLSPPDVPVSRGLGSSRAGCPVGDSEVVLGVGVRTAGPTPRPHRRSLHVSPLAARAPASGHPSAGARQGSSLWMTAAGVVSGAATSGGPAGVLHLTHAHAHLILMALGDLPHLSGLVEVHGVAPQHPLVRAARRGLPVVNVEGVVDAAPPGRSQ